MTDIVKRRLGALEAATTNLSAAELAVLDGVTAGTAVASKALVLDSSGDLVLPASGNISKAPVALTAAASLTAAAHANRVLYVTGTAAAAYTLPEATGTGNKYEFFIGEVNTNGTTFVAADTTNASMRGTMNLVDQDHTTQGAYAAASGDDTLTMNGTTQGGQIGDTVVFTDLATDLWGVVGFGVVPAGSNIADPWSSAA
jgi:hypothetical protein